MKIATLIPARLGSTRLSKKLLIKVKEKSIVQWTYEAASKSKLSDFVAVLTDSKEIYDCITSIGGNAYIVTGDFNSGTDRIAYFVKDKDIDIVVNVQADEPLITADTIDKLINFIIDKNLPISTVAIPCNACADEVNDVKVVIDNRNLAIYFSRSKIPYNANPYHNYLKHVGIYAYRKDALLKFSNLAQSDLERAEKLEQLRALENGIPIGVKVLSAFFIGIDTIFDVEKFKQYLSNH